MIIGLPKETKDQELRVGITPAGVNTLIKSGNRVLVQKNAGVGSGISDDSYIQVGAELVKTPETLFSSSDLIVKVKEFQLHECELLRPGLTTFSFLSLGINPKLAQALMQSEVTAIAYETKTELFLHFLLIVDFLFLLYSIHSRVVDDFHSLVP